MLGRRRLGLVLPGCLLILLLVLCMFSLKLHAVLGESVDVNVDAKADASVDTEVVDKDSNPGTEKAQINENENVPKEAAKEAPTQETVTQETVTQEALTKETVTKETTPKAAEMKKQEIIAESARRAEEEAATKTENIEEDNYRFDYDGFDPEAGYNPENYYAGEGDVYEDEDLESGFHMDDFTPDHVLSFPVDSGREECFFSEVETVPLKLRGAYFVSGGGVLDINMKVAIVRVARAHGQDNVEQVLQQYSGKNENVFSITATERGQYSFCFNNPSSRYGEKTITFALNVGKRQFHKEHVKGEHMVRLANTLHEARRTLHELEGEAHFLQERTRRHMLIQDSTEWRVAWYTVFESIFMFAIAIGQVAYVQRLINQRAWV